MTKRIRILVALQLLVFYCTAQVTVQHLQTENLSDPICVDAKVPRLSWQLQSADRNVLQTAYEIRVSSHPDGKDVVWASGKVMSGQSIQVDYSGPGLQAGKRYYWQVRVWDNKGRLSAWSERAWWQMGLLEPANWVAQWIQPGLAGSGDGSGPAAGGTDANPLLRTTFTARQSIASAIVYITAHGLYEAQINGQRIGDAYLTPGWTSYNKHLQYQAYDVTEMVRQGKNAVGVTLANGWYRGYIAFEGHKNVFGKDISLLLQLVIRYKDGHTDTVATGPGWKSSTGEVLMAEIYNGETIDHRKE